MTRDDDSNGTPDAEGVRAEEATLADVLAELKRAADAYSAAGDATEDPRIEWKVKILGMARRQCLLDLERAIADHGERSTGD